MAQTMTRQELTAMVGRELGASDWLLIDQARVNAFADVTLDHQFVHVDVERKVEHAVILAALVDAAAIDEGFAVIGAGDGDAASGERRAQTAKTGPGRPKLVQERLFGDAVVRNIAVSARRARYRGHAQANGAAKGNSP